MNNTYYNQKYTAPKKEVPNASFKQIMKETFGKLFKWNARTTRKTFWTGLITTSIVEMIINMIWFAISFRSFPAPRPAAFGYGFRYGSTFPFKGISPSLYIIGAIIFLISAYLLLCQLGLMVRRLHDINVSGWWLWLSFIPTAGWVIILLGLLFPTLEKPVKWNHYLSL